MILGGVQAPSNDRTVSRDIPRLARAFYRQAKKPAGSVLPFFVVSRDYQPQSGDFILFTGTDISNDAVFRAADFPGPRLEIPSGLYAAITVRPLFGLFWGLAIGRAKRWFYTQWLPESGYAPVNLEYELHDKRSSRWFGSIELLFGIREDNLKTYF